MFEWDEAKSVSNRLKHGLSFDEAVAIFDGPVLSLLVERPLEQEMRTMSIGRVGSILVVAVVHTDRDGRGLFPPAPRVAARGNFMTTISDKRLEDLKRLAERPDAEIDFSEIPELDEAFFKNAALVMPDRTEHVTLRVKKSVIDAYRRQGKGHTSRMSAVLETYAKAVLK